MYPIEKYRFYVDSKQCVYAVTSFAGQKVTGKAICADGDKFDLELGKKIAAARCNAKVAQKRYARAEKKLQAADEAVARAREWTKRMEDYYYDSQDQLNEAYHELDTLMEQFN